MSILPAVRQFFTMQASPIPERTERAFVTGSAAVDRSQQYFGIDNQQYQPPEYADYPATSNGVYACVNVRSRTLASLPLKVYKLQANGGRTEITSGPLWLLLRKVNPYWTLSRLLDMTEQALCVWGESFWFMERKGRQPSEIWWARADRVKVHPHPTEYISHFTYEGPSGKEIRFERDETVWLRYANVANQYSGLSPLAAARLAADTASAAMHSNFNIFRNGVQMAGVLVPKQGTNLTPDQAEEIAHAMDKRFRGVDKAHRLGVLRYDIDVKTLSMTPKDAEFLGAMNWSLEDIARAYSVPIDKIGGKRTYQNVEESEKVFWHDCMLPEARFIAAELTEQLLPHFGDNLLAEFDTSDVDVLHEAENDRWTRRKEMIASGYRTVNQLLKEDGLDPQPWGDVWWAQSTLVPIDSNEKPEPVIPPGLAAGAIGEQDDEIEDGDPAQTEQDAERRRPQSRIAYGSAEHQDAWNRYVTQTAPYESQWGRMTADLFNAQKQSILAQVYRAGGRSMKRDDDDSIKLPPQELTEAEKTALAKLADDPFDRQRWIKAFRVEGRELVGTIAEAAGNLAASEVGLATGFNVKDPNIIRGIERQAQKFAEEVNATTWQALKDSIQAGIHDGEDIDTIARRVESVMGDRIRSSGEAIARTEVTRASNFGTVEGWRQSGVVTGKQWLAALDDRTRATHVEAHGQTVGLDEDFSVGGCSGPAPGDIDCAREVVNCRCTLVAVLDVQA